MEILFAAYVVYVVAALMWCATRATPGRISYRPLRRSELEGWRLGDADPIIVELFQDDQQVPLRATIPSALVVRRSELMSLLTWAPPRTTFVFKTSTGERLDPTVEDALLRVGILSVYLLREGQENSRSRASRSSA